MPDSAVLTFTDPDVYHAAIRNAQVEGVVTARGNFRAELTRIDLHRLWMLRGEESLARVYNVAIGSRAAIFFAIDRNSPEYIDGMELPQGQILVFGLGSVGHLRTAAGCQWGTMSLTFEDLAAAGQAIIGREVIAPSDTHCIRPPPQLMSRLSSLHEAAGHLAKTAPDILAQPEVARAMEQALVHAMVSCLSGGETAETSSAHHRHAVIMRRLEELLEANPDRTLYLAELCSAAGVSETNAPHLLPRASGNEFDALFVAAAHASGPPGPPNSRSGGDDRDRGRDELWLLGIRALFGGVSVAVRGVALGSAAPAPRGPATAKKYRFALAVAGICIVSRGPKDLPSAFGDISGRHRGLSDRGSDPVGMQESGCREAAQAPLSIPMITRRDLTIFGSISLLPLRVRFNARLTWATLHQPTAAAQRGGSAAHRLYFAGADAGICRVCDASGPADGLGRHGTANRGHNIPQAGRAVSSADDRPLQLEPGGNGSRAPRKIL